MEVKILNAKDLKAADNIKLGFKTIKGKSDPYCLVKFGQLEKRTRHIDKDLNPVWDETLHFLIPQPPPEEIEIEVLDHDLIGGDDKLGLVIVKRSDVMASARHTGWGA